MRVLVIGIGNPIAGDDGVGIRAIAQLRKTISDERISLVESERGGLDLLDLLEGYSRALIIDAAWTGTKPPGTISSFSICRPFAVETLPSLHTIGLCTVLAFGTTMGINLPKEVTVYTVEARDIETFHEGCTPDVEGAIQDLTDMLVRELRRILSDVSSARVERHDAKQPILDTISMEFV
jgi:hydrogenase maturation protease